MENVRAHLIIYGLVQGVCFRYETKMFAQSLGIKGWVMNRLDGGVEVVFEGPSEAVKSAIEWCRHGPSGAVVEDVRIEWEPYKGEFKDFNIRYSR